MPLKRLFLIDGSGLIFRAFFAIRHLSNREGHPTNATFGFTQMLRKVVSDHEFTHIAVAFDEKAKTFRHEMFPEYKANRPEPPEELVPQFADIREIVEAHNIAKLAVPGYEADDIIGTLSRQAVEQGFDEVVIITNDKDLCQLVGDKVKLLDTRKDEWTDAEKVKERFGTDPAGVIDALALSGDTSDNIPGVPGVGEKTAKKLLEQFGTFEGVFNGLDELKGKLKERLAENRDKADLARELVKIHTEVPLDCTLDDLIVKEPDRDKLVDLFTRFEFQALLENAIKPKSDIDRSKYVLVTDTAGLFEMAGKLKASGRFAVDTETDSTDPIRANLVGLSFCCDDEVAYYLPVAHRYLGVPDHLNWKQAKAVLEPIFTDEKIAKIGHNIKYDYLVLHRAGVKLAGVTFDTILASYVLDPGRMSNSLDSLALDMLGHKCIAFKEVAGTGREQKTFDEVPLDAATRYAAEDAHITWLLAQKLEPEITGGQKKLFETIEMPLWSVLATMEQNGVRIDETFFKELNALYEKIMREAEKEIQELAGHEFNLNSPKQVATVLFDEIGLKPVKKTKSGPSTDVTVLEALADKHEIPNRLLAYRQMHKLISTYIATLPKLINPETGRIHTSFNQTVAATGRLSSSDPNLQNIPVRTEDGRRIRQGFVPEEGNVLISADYSQIELRVMAHLADDKAMIAHFRSGEDIHLRTAAEVFGLMPGLVSKEQRSSAKAINFGILYGISAFRLGKDLEIGTRKAQEYIDLYFQRYPGVKNFLEETLEKAKKTGYVETMFGRRRLLPQLSSKDRQTQSFGQRIAYNTPIQGTAADLIKIAMIELQNKIEKESLPLKMLIQVHDELVLEGPKSEADALMQIVKDVMESAAELKVPLLVDAAYGENWAEIH